MPRKKHHKVFDLPPELERKFINCKEGVRKNNKKRGTHYNEYAVCRTVLDI